MTMNDIGNKIKTLCKEQRLTQAKLAQNLGISEVSMSRYVRGQRIPRAMELLKIAKATGSSCEELLGYEDNYAADYLRIKQLLRKNCKRMTKTEKAKLIMIMLED